MKDIIQLQYKAIIDDAMIRTEDLRTPNEGWLRTVRKALWMTGAQLARRCGVSRALISHTELAELDGTVTLRNLSKLADSIDCKLVYAIVPNTSIAEIIGAQSKRKASELVSEASIHMSLESQALGKSQLEDEIQRVADQLVTTKSRQLWSD